LSGAFLYAGSQASGRVFLYDLPITTPSANATDLRVSPHSSFQPTYNDLAAMSINGNQLLLSMPGEQRLLLFRLSEGSEPQLESELPVPITDAEGITFLPALVAGGLEALIVASDDGVSVTKLRWDPVVGPQHASCLSFFKSETIPTPSASAAFTTKDIPTSGDSIKYDANAHTDSAPTSSGAGAYESYRGLEMLVTLASSLVVAKLLI
jgi:hypothetical protein